MLGGLGGNHRPVLLDPQPGGGGLRRVRKAATKPCILGKENQRFPNSKRGKVAGLGAGRSSGIRQATGRRRLLGVRKAEGVRPTSDALLPCLGAIPQHFSLSDGWSSGWKTNNPACGYPHCSMGRLGGRSIGPSQHTPPPSTEPFDGGTHRIQARLPSVDVPLGTPLYRLRQTSRNIRFG